MNTIPYTKPSLHTCYYRKLTSNNDLPYYQRKAEEIQTVFETPSILELACGEGRILETLLDSNAELSGLDNSTHMLSNVKANVAEKTKLYHACMCEFSLPDQFHMIILGIRTLHMLTREEQQKCIKNAAAHMLPSGTLHLHVVHIAKLDYAKLKPQPKRIVVPEGVLTRHTIRYKVTPARQEVEALVAYELTNNSGAKQRELETIRFHWITEDEMYKLAKDAGLSISNYHTIGPDRIYQLIRK